MNCSEVMEQLCSVVDCRLGGKELEEFKKHTEVCKRCKDEYDLERITKKFLQSSLRPIPPPPYLEHRVLNRIDSNINSVNLFARITSFFGFITKRWYITIGFTTAIILIFVLTQNPSSHSHNSPNDNNLIHLVYNNFDALQKGEMASFTQTKNPQLKIPNLKDCSLVGGCVTAEKGQQVTHSVYKHENCIIYCLQINFDSIKNNPQLTLPSHVFAELKESGRYVADMHECCSVILWVKDNNLFAAAAEMDKNNLMTYLIDTETQW